MNMNNHDYYETSAIKPSEAISMLAFCSSSLPTGFSSSSNKNCSSSTDSGSSSSSSCDVSSHGSSSSQQQTKKVRFCMLEVRKYPTTIGEGRPSRGVPALQMGWDHIEQTTTHIDAFERQRQHQRRHGEELLIDSITRGQILRSLGYSRDELRRVAMLTAINSSSCYQW
jgi:hypothetical protein